MRRPCITQKKPNIREKNEGQKDNSAGPKSVIIRTKRPIDVLPEYLYCCAIEAAVIHMLDSGFLLSLWRFKC
jgi:hypothetical protein